MDSSNLSETQSTRMTSKNTASNTNPIACACCGSKDYVQTISQNNFFKTVYPGTPRCKHCPEGIEDNLTIQPFFPSFPLFHPFFHSSTVPPNVYFPQNIFEDVAPGVKHPPEQKRSKSGTENQTPFEDNRTFDQKDRSYPSSTKTSMDENHPKPFGAFGTELQFLMNPYHFPNATDSQFNPCIQRCACGNNPLWTRSPFIIPMISYCLFWNSQKYNSQHEMLHQHKREPQDMRLDKDDHQHLIASMEKRNCTSEECQGRDDLLKCEWKTDKNTDSSTVLVVHEIKFPEENNLSNAGKKYESGSSENESNGAHTDEAMEMECFVEEPRENEKLLLKNEETSNNSNLCISDSMALKVDYLKDGDRRPQLIQQEKETSSYEDCIDHLDTPKMSTDKIQDSEEEHRKLRRECTTTNFKERMSFKKFIKNFTITDRTTGGTTEEVLISSVGAGDVGGEHCSGYRVPIVPIERDQQERIRQETHAEGNSYSEVLILKGLNEQEKEQSDSLVEKNEDAVKRNSPLKSRIGKYSSFSKGRETKELTKETGITGTNHEEPSIVKRKHSCIPNDIIISHFADNSKTQKVNNMSFTRQKTQGRLQKVANAKNQPVKKEEKAPSIKAQPHSNQKQQSTSLVKNR